MSSTIKARVLEGLEALPEKKQKQVLAFVQALQTEPRRGMPGKKLLPFAGSISSDDVEIMRVAIEEACGQVNLNEW